MSAPAGKIASAAAPRTRRTGSFNASDIVFTVRLSAGAIAASDWIAVIRTNQLSSSAAATNIGTAHSAASRSLNLPSASTAVTRVA